MKSRPVKLLILAASFIALQAAAMPQAGAEAKKFNFIPSSSKILFHAKSTLHDFDGSASSISGFAEGDIENSGEAANGFLEVAVSSMSTADSWRDHYMTEDMDATNFPLITFRLKKFTIVRKPRSEDDPYRISIDGILRMHGVEKEITFSATLSLAGALLNLKATVSLSLGDYGIKPTSFLFLRVQDTVVVDFDLNGSTL